MPAKRSRIARSSSLGETDMFTQVNPVSIDAPTALWEKTAAPAQKFSNPSYVIPDKSCRRVLTIASPVREPSVQDPQSSFDAKVGSFLEACYLCKKKLGESDDIFMYSYLRAFCSCKCRDQQIALDRGIGNSAGGSTENAALINREQNLKGCFGAQKPQM